MPVIENLKTIDLPFALLLVPPRSATHAGEVVVVVKPKYAFAEEPPNELNSVAALQLLDPFVPFK